MISPRRGDIVWIAFDPSVGTEIQKTRPAVVMSNSISNLAMERMVVVPLTSNTYRFYPAEVRIQVGAKTSKALAHQITSVSLQRLRGFLGKVNEAEMKRVERAIALHLGMPQPEAR